MLQTAPASSSLTDDDLAEATWRRTRRLSNADWASKPAIQQKVRELCGVGRPTPTPVAVRTLSRFESGSRVVVVGRRTLGAKVA